MPLLNIWLTSSVYETAFFMSCSTQTTLWESGSLSQLCGEEHLSAFPRSCLEGQCLKESGIVSGYDGALSRHPQKLIVVGHGH